MGNLVCIWIKRAHGGPMDRVGEAEMIAGHGLRGNADQGGRRQVTLVDEGAWAEAQLELGVDVDPSARRANILLRGIDLQASRSCIKTGANCSSCTGVSRRTYCGLTFQIH